MDKTQFPASQHSDRVSDVSLARADKAPRAGEGRPLRRWSVAELIARALTAPPAESVGHC
jgi:hypothetical protein